MNKKFCRNIATIFGLFLSFTASADTLENFNSREGIALNDLRGKLQDACWTFHHFDINQQGWNPSIEGDGAMVSSTDALSSGNAGIYTPLLTVPSTIQVSFDYRFNHDFAASDRRWIKICLADANNVLKLTLDQVELIGINATAIRRYSTRFDNIAPGEYRVVILYGGSGGDAVIAIDDLKTSAPLKFTEGCVLAPASSDLEFRGESDRTAKGQLLTEKEQKSQKIFLVRNADNGKIELAPDGRFVFAPAKGFRGNSTHFSFRICNENGNNLCSDPIVATINFPTVHITRFNGSYKSNGRVELLWNTQAGTAISKFEVERSTDGRSWVKSTELKVQPGITNADGYTYLDHVGKNVALKKDLYYRIRHTDTTGNISTSNPMIVRVYNHRSLTMICVAPNPLKREIAVNVQLQEPSMISMRVFDPSENLLIHRTVSVDRGINNIVVEGSSELAPGNYVLEVSVNSNERMLVNLIKE